MHINLEKIKKLPPDVKKDFYKMYLKYTEKKHEAKVRGDFLSFVKHMWPDFIQGSHHKIVAKKFNDMAEESDLIRRYRGAFSPDECKKIIVLQTSIFRPDNKLAAIVTQTQIILKFKKL